MELFHKNAIQLVKTPHALSRAEYDKTTGISVDDSVNFMLAFRDTIFKQGYCYVQINDKTNDYYGSIAKFVLDDPNTEYQNAQVELAYGAKQYNVSFFFYGRLRWKGKANKPKYTLTAGDVVLLGEDIDTVFCRVDKKAEQQKALSADVNDIDGNKLEVGDKVLCLSIAYGSGSSLEHGTIHEFKAIYSNGSTRVETYVKLDGTEYIQKCNYPTEQIYKKP